MNELPAMAQYAHTHSVYRPDQILTGSGQMLASQNVGARAPNQQALSQVIHEAQQRQKGTPMSKTPRRIVQVFIADADENMPLDKCLVYQGEQKLTDATDEELFFEIDIKTLLDTHNAERVKLVNKKVRERTEYLEPARIRDLKMTVVTVAQF